MGFKFCSFLVFMFTNYEYTKGLITLSTLGQVVRMVVDNIAAGHLYSRLIPLVLLLVDGKCHRLRFIQSNVHNIILFSFVFNDIFIGLGSNPIDVTDPSWELYLLIQNKKDQQGEIQHRLLGFLATYRFFHYPDSTRMRLSQV